jgi:hypothetical protein
MTASRIRTSVSLSVAVVTVSSFHASLAFLTAPVRHRDPAFSIQGQSTCRSRLPSNLHTTRKSCVVAGDSEQSGRGILRISCEFFPWPANASFGARAWNFNEPLDPSRALDAWL